MARLTRAAKKELTSAQLLDTARSIFLKRGYHRSTLDEIAEAAGVTKGAVYARFASKDELFFALLEQREEAMIAAYNDGARLETFEASVLHDARRAIALRRAEADWYLLVLEFWTYAARDQRLRREFAARHNRTLKRIAERIEATAARYGVRLPLPALDTARAASAMSLGYILERLADPVGVPESLLESMFAMLAHQAMGAPKSGRGARKKSVGDGRTSRIARRNQHASGNSSASGKVR